MTDMYSNRTLTAFFDDRADAEDAVRRLGELGITGASVRLVGGEEYRTESVYEDKGFWETLGDFFFPDEDRAFYSEGLRRGGYLVTVNGISGDRYAQALDILDDEGSVDMDERAVAWRTEGWSGSTAAGTAAGQLGASRSGTAAPDLVGRDASLRDDEVIPVVEEELRVGKRDVNLGRVRVRSYVVEEPVSEQVSLREDRVEIERRPVDRPLTGDEHAFTDRTIEAEEHAEEAVVAKEARVKEEIGLRRSSDERTETISDTVRHTEVEVEDERDIDRPGQTIRRGA